MHPRNLHIHGYDFAALAESVPALAGYTVEKFGRITIDFTNPAAVKCLNQALLKHHYRVQQWDLPQGFLCPSVPGRADYIHHLADLLAADNGGIIPTGKKLIGLDIGTGANLVYPIIGSASYGWQVVGSEVDKTALNCARLIASSNPALSKLIKLREQSEPTSIFAGVIHPQDQFAFTMCNPPFHASAQDAVQGSSNKIANLARNRQKRTGIKTASFKTGPVSLNFAGQATELWCEGGELAFVKRMISESQNHTQQVGWFTSLISNKDHLKPLCNMLEGMPVSAVKTINMAQGNKVSRFLAWRY